METRRRSSGRNIINGTSGFNSESSSPKYTFFKDVMVESHCRGSDGNPLFRRAAMLYVRTAAPPRHPPRTSFASRIAACCWLPQWMKKLLFWI